MTAAVSLESGIFVAFLNRRDRWHPQARALFDGPKPKWSTSLAVVSKAYSWFLHRMGEGSARNLRLLVDALPGLRVFEATAEHHKATTRVLDRFRGSKLTYVDASSLALIEQHKIARVRGTDHHLALTGREVFPRLCSAWSRGATGKHEAPNSQRYWMALASGGIWSRCG